MRYRYSRPFHMSDYIPVAKNEKVDLERITDREERRSIQLRIRELKKLGFPEDQALERIYTEFSDSDKKGFFKTWVENVYKVKIKTPFTDDIRGEVDGR